VRIRPETDADHTAIRAVVAAAFESRFEADLVDAIRATDRFVPGLSLVAEVDGVVAGHVLVSYVDLEPGSVRVLQVAPLAVAPAHQRQGVGSALMNEAIRLVEARREPLLLVEGDPRYYSRFGFRRSHESGIEAPADVEPQYLMVRRLDAYDPSIGGRLVYPEAFGSVS
jgi:putative acetyltransferase